MKRTFFDTYEELADYMIDRAQDGFYSVAVLFYKDAMKLLRELLLYDDVKVEALSIEPEDYSGYDREYYVSLADDMIACVEPAYSNGRYLTTEADITLIDGEASSLAVCDLDESKCQEIYIGVNEDKFDKDECEDENSDCEDDDDSDFEEFLDSLEIIKNKKGEPIGIKGDASKFIEALLLDFLKYLSE